MNRIIGFSLLGIAVAVVGCSSNDSSSACAVSSSSSARAAHRIRNGSTPSAGEFKNVGRILIDGSRLCTGTLIRERVVLTAAHCFRELPVASAATVTFPGNGAIIATGYKFHPSYSNAGNLYTTPDLAVVFLASAPSGTPTTELSCTRSETSENVVAAGYGFNANDNANGGLGTLLYGLLKITSPSTDVQNIVAEGRVQPFNAPTSQDTCAGDSGGPLFPSNTFSEIRGVLSGGEYHSGIDDCEHSKNSIFTDVSRFNSWINDNAASSSGAISL